MAKKDSTYSEQMAELQKVLQELEGGELSIDDAVQHYARGLELTASLEQRLKQAENRVKELRAA